MVGASKGGSQCSMFALFKAQSSESKTPYAQWKSFAQQNLKEKHRDQDSKYKEVIEGISERDLQLF